MRNKITKSASDDIILNLKVLAEEKESVRRKLAVTAEKLAATAKKLAITAKEKESVRRKLAITAKEKESVRRKLVITASKLAATAEKLAATAKEKETVRRKLAVTAAKLAVTAQKLALTAEKLALTAAKLAETAEEKEGVRRKLVVTAKKKETVRRKLAVTAEKLKASHATLENKVIERTKSLEMSRVKEEAILLSIGDGLIVTDENGIITIINRTAEILLEEKSKEVVGKNFFLVSSLVDEKGLSIPVEQHPISMALKTLTVTAAMTGSTYFHIRKNSTRFPIAITATPVILHGKVIGTIKVFRDITYEREIDKAKTEFVSLASHQLRTPLSAVNWYSEMLLEGDVGELNEKQKKYLDEVYRSNQRMVELVNALLDVASLELGTFVIEPKSTDICKLALSVISEQKPQISSKKMKFSFLCAKNVSLMRTDPKLLRMVMQNILSNAVKYTPNGGKINFNLSLKDKKTISIQVSDNGYGIPKNQQDQIFTKLFRADNVRDKDTDGTGLGLYIVKSIIQNSGGKVWFKSLGGEENKGTTFFVTLPLKGKEKTVKVVRINK